MTNKNVNVEEILDRLEKALDEYIEFLTDKLQDPTLTIHNDSDDGWHVEIENVLWEKDKSPLMLDFSRHGVSLKEAVLSCQQEAFEEFGVT